MNGFLVLSGFLCLLAASVAILRYFVTAPGDGERTWSERPEVRARRNAEKERDRQRALRQMRQNGADSASGMN